jgi:hypothetical protein
METPAHLGNEDDAGRESCQSPPAQMLQARSSCHPRLSKPAARSRPSDDLGPSADHHWPSARRKDDRNGRPNAADQTWTAKIESEHLPPSMQAMKMKSLDTGRRPISVNTR